MVLVQDPLRLEQVELLLVLAGPRQSDEPVEVRPDDGGLGGGLRHLLEAAELLERLLLDVLGHPRVADLVLVLVDLGLDLVELPELLLDGLELLAQEVLALGLAHRLLDAVLDLRAQLEDLELLAQEGRRLLEALLGLDGLEDGLLLLGLEVEMERDEVGETAGLLDGPGGHEHLLRDRLAQLGGRLEVADQGPHERLGLDVDVRRLLDELDAHLEVRLGLDELDDPEALEPLDERLGRAVGQLELLQDGADAADLVEISDLGLLRLGLPLGHERDVMVAAHRLLEGEDRLLAADEQRHDEVGEQHEVPQRDQREDVGDLRGLVVGSGHGRRRPFAGCDTVCGSTSTWYPSSPARAAARGEVASKAPRMNHPTNRIAALTALVAVMLLAIGPGPATAVGFKRGPVATLDLAAPAWVAPNGFLAAGVRVRLREPVGRMTVRVRVYDDAGHVLWQRTQSERALEAVTYAFSFTRSVRDIPLGPGTYTVRAQADVSGGAAPVTTTSTLIVADPKRPPVPVAVVVRIAGAPMRDPQGRFVVDPATDVRSHSEAASLAQLALLRPDLRLSAAVPPILLDEWRDTADGYTYAGAEGLIEVSSESSVSASCRATLDAFARARTQGMPLLRGMYAEPDLSGLLRIGGVPQDVADQLRLGSLAASEALAASGATASAEATGLAVLGDAIPLRPALAAADEGVSFLLVGASSVRVSQPGTALPMAYAITRSGDATSTSETSLTALVIDQAGSRLLADPAAAQVLARRLFDRSMSKTPAGQPVLLQVTVGPGGARVADLQQSLSALARLPWVRFIDAPAAGAVRPAARATLVDRPERDDAPAGYWEDVERARARVRALEGAAGPADPQGREALRDVFVAESRTWAGPAAGWPLADRGRSFAAAGDRMAWNVLSKIIVEVPTVTLSGSSGKMPVSIQNGSDKVLSVVVIADSPGMRLPRRRITAQLRPGENILSVPVDLEQALSGSIRIGVTAGGLTLASKAATVRASYLDRFVVLGGVVSVLAVLLWYIRRRSRAALARTGESADDSGHED